eukprot:scaffold9438_cov129-Isochrysis_galbana.AAC.3
MGAALGLPYFVVTGSGGYTTPIEADLPQRHCPSPSSIGSLHRYSPDIPHLLLPVASPRPAPTSNPPCPPSSADHRRLSIGPGGCLQCQLVWPHPGLEVRQRLEAALSKGCRRPLHRTQ